MKRTLIDFNDQRLLEEERIYIEVSKLANRIKNMRDLERYHFRTELKECEEWLDSHKEVKERVSNKRLEQIEKWLESRRNHHF